MLWLLGVHVERLVVEGDALYYLIAVDEDIDLFDFAHSF